MSVPRQNGVGHQTLIQATHRSGQDHSGLDDHTIPRSATLPPRCRRHGLTWSSDFEVQRRANGAVAQGRRQNQNITGVVVREYASRRPLTPTLLTRLFYGWVLLWGSLITVVTAVGYLAIGLFFRKPAVFRWWTKCWSRLIFFGAGIRLECEHLTSLDCKKSYVFAANHQILLDIPLLAMAIDCPFGFVAKSELARVPFLGHAIRFSPSVFVDRTSPRDMYESMQRAARQIQVGTSVIIFPEGARSYAKDFGSFQKGAFSLALEAGVPIVPVTILDAYNVLNEQLRMARPGIVRIVVGAPISLEGLSRSDLPDIMESVRTELLRPFQSEARRLDSEPVN